MQKIELRKKIRKEIENIPEEKKLLESQKCFSNLRSMDFFSDTDIVFSYNAMKNEIDSSPLNENILKEKQLLLPRVIPGTSDMDFFFLQKDKPLENQLERNPENQYEINEPFLIEENRFDFDKTDITGKKILVIVPGVAFTKEGDRLGHGKGFYDVYLKALKKCCNEKKAKLILCGMSYDCQVVEEIPYEEHDVRMDYVICAGGIFFCLL